MKISSLVIGMILTMTIPSVFADIPDVHDMFLFGDKVTYGSHFSMYMAPHDYQVIFKLRLKSEPYERAKKAGEAYFRITPEVMDLSQVISGFKNHFSAQLFAGYSEDNAEMIGMVDVEVEKVVFNKRLHEDEAQSIPDKYFIFGENGEYFSAHIVNGKPGLDEISKVTLPHTQSSTFKETMLPITVNGPKNPQQGDSLGSPAEGSADIQKVLYYRVMNM